MSVVTRVPRSPAASSPVPSGAASERLARIREAGNGVLGLQPPTDHPRPHGHADRWRIATAMTTEFQETLADLRRLIDEACRDAMVPGSPLAEAITALKHDQLDLMALAVDPAGGRRFDSALHAAIHHWGRCIAFAQEAVRVGAGLRTT